MLLHLVQWILIDTRRRDKRTGRNGTGENQKLRESPATESNSSCDNHSRLLILFSVPLARPVPPEDVARTILFLASERYSGSVHGQVIPIDAGKTGSLVWAPQELEERKQSLA